MYYGKMTKELEKLYSDYNQKWNCTPDCYENAEYGADEYADYVSDIKAALEQNVELPQLYPHNDEF